jgi:hypothetical protein
VLRRWRRGFFPSPSFTPAALALFERPFDPQTTRKVRPAFDVEFVEHGIIQFESRDGDVLRQQVVFASAQVFGDRVIVDVCREP